MKMLIWLLIGIGCFTAGCNVINNNATSSSFQYSITVVARESGGTIAVVMNAFIKTTGTPVVNMQQNHLIEQQIEFKLDCIPMRIRNLSKLKEELLKHPEVLNVFFERAM